MKRNQGFPKKGHPDIKPFQVPSFAFLILHLFFFTSGSAWAETDVVILEPVVVSASRMPLSSQSTSASTTLITREDITARQSASVIDLLRHTPGLHIDQAGGRGGVSTIFMRGADPNFTVVMIDGVKMNASTNRRGGAFDFSLLDPESIERIEIVRGPLSSIYGSDAMGGLVNIITRQGTSRPRFSFETGLASQGAAQGRFSARGPLGSADYALNLSYINDGAPVSGSRFKGRNLHLNMTASPSNQRWLKFTSYYGAQKRESFPDDSGGPKFAALRTVDLSDASEWMSGLTFGHAVHEAWTYELQIDFFEHRETQDSPGVAPGLRDPFGIPPNRSKTTFRRRRLLLNNRLTPTPALQMSFGAETQYEKGESDSTLFFPGLPTFSRFDLDRSSYAVFLETQYTFPLALTLEGSLRIDDPEGFDAEISPRLGATYHIESTDTTLKSSWGKGFKLASFFALGNTFVGNPALLPERSNSFEIGLVQGFLAKRLVLNGSFFHNRFFNLIDLDEGPPPQLVNQSEVTTKGGEMALTFQASETLSATGHLSYTQTEIKNSDARLRNRPKWRGGLNLHWRASKKLSSSLAFLSIGKVHDSSIPTGDRNLDAYTRVDVSANWSWSANWRVFVAADNLLDENYEEAIGFPAPGIRVRFALKFSA